MARHTPHHQPGPAAERLIPAPKMSVEETMRSFIAEAAQDIVPPSREAVELATKLNIVFDSVFEPRSAGGKRKGAVATDLKVFVSMHDIGHHRVGLNRDAAATLAAKPVTAAAIRKWFDATGMERRKDLYHALHVHPSTLSRAEPQTEMDASVTERMLRHSDLLVRAAEVFGEEGKTWLTKRHDLLEGKTPMEFAGNEYGGAKVRAMLNAIEYGGVV
ncbi:MbcA/ParS/Xre antitoxin family protein [Variovorax sp. RA8]|uniref:MbcA/ParS/Xre antitoxin family protein n=1 Tax=Variovorax sp. (strain JCM 16519 / RA8) TaxID=662548 RepID=UPI0013169D7F|nr:MbcA/ParS/Xre antitoxin family protein [Variovorax sp. RA8]VTU14390.1 putative toxin-antitoxin system antitoxin component [Variovorax sp. RA8]